MDAAARAELIARYSSGYQEVVDALEGLSDADLDHRTAPGHWTAREIVHHLADSEMTAAIRLRRLLAEDHPVIQGYDEEEFARRLHYERPTAASLEALRAARLSSASLLECLTEEEWRREGTHSDSGRYTVEDWLAIYTRHAHDHADQIRRALSNAGRV
jgi:hypothetical protein